MLGQTPLNQRLYYPMYFSKAVFFFKGCGFGLGLKLTSNGVGVLKGMYSGPHWTQPLSALWRWLRFETCLKFGITSLLGLPLPSFQYTIRWIPTILVMSSIQTPLPVPWGTCLICSLKHFFFKSLKALPVNTNLTQNGRNACQLSDPSLGGACLH